jgi:HD superfamily phosphodiesterase
LQRAARYNAHKPIAFLRIFAMHLTAEQLQRAADFVRSYLRRTASSKESHKAEFRAENRWQHSLNVQKNIRALADGEGIPSDSRAVCDLAALFHDVDHYTVDYEYHGLRGAETATHFLLSEGYPPPFVERVAEAIRRHHNEFEDDVPLEDQMRAVVTNASLEARLLMDAETLDKIGASNIIQSLLTLGRIGTKPINVAARELVAGFPLERAHEWYRTLITPTGRKLGAQRLAFYEQFLAQIESEIVIEDPYPERAPQDI